MGNVNFKLFTLERSINKMEKFIPLSVPNINGNEEKYVTEALRTEWVSTVGSFVNDFEVNVASYTHTKKASACQSGTAGLHLSLISCDVGAGDEVIVPTLTFIAAVNVVRYVGAECIFMDCDDTLCMDIDKLDEFLKNNSVIREGKLINLNSGRTIKAVIAVHIFGNMVNMEKLINVSQKYGLKVIEDATEALGSYLLTGKYAGRYAGSIGDAGVFSFNGNKIITTGGGGMVVSNSEALIDRVKYLSTQAKKDELYFIHDEIGYNYRMTNIQAALGLGQLENLEKFITIKKKNYDLYNKIGVKLLPFRDDIRPNYWFYSYLTERRDELIEYLGKNNIQARPIWKLIHTLKPYENCFSYMIQKANYYYNRIVNIPCSTNLGADEINIISERILEFERK